MGLLTFIEMFVLSVVMLFLLMGVGLIFSSIVKTDTSIPLVINLFGFPQMLLSGTFFPVTVFPQWLQDICYFLPLTQFNNAMRKISFEGLHLLDTWKEIGILGIWIIIIYIILVRLFAGNNTLSFYDLINKVCEDSPAACSSVLCFFF